ncbi:N-acetylglucosamine-6-phosphate deacetylase [compost metagenome]
MGPLLLKHGKLVTPEGLLEADLLVVGGKIAAIGRDLDLPPETRTLDVRGNWVLPGFIDTHVHGGLDADTMQASPEAFATISRHLARHGVTAWVPTLFACPADALDRVLGAIEEAMRQEGPGARILGAHLESSFIAPKFKGAQPPEALRPIEDPALREVIRRHAANIRIVTLAPELAGATALIEELVELGIRVSIGHTDATYEQAIAGAQAGATRVTHLCNAMRPFHHREPGTVGAALVQDGLDAELIADLVHVHPAGIQIAYRCKGADRLMLVSDALMGTGLPPGIHVLEGREILIGEDVAKLPDGTIAGSIITLDRALRNVVEAAGIPLPDASRMASLTPARSLGFTDRGALEVGMRADLALLDAEFRCQGTLVAGERVDAP